MYKILTIILIFGLFSTKLFGQIQPVDVAEITIKIEAMGSKELLYGFAKGDQIIFNFEEVKGKEIKEVEIIELPNFSKFMDYKSSKIENKTINVNKQAVYQFKFTNSSLSGRICKIIIKRIPKTEDLITFNTNWEWKTLYDSTYVPYLLDSLTGYETTYIQRTVKELIQVDTLVTELFNKTERVHSETALNKIQYSYINVSLPENIYSPNKSYPYKSTEVISWSYWLGVGQKAYEVYEQANKKLSAGINAIGALTGYGALASLAVSGISMFGTPSVGDNVQYQFITIQNGIRKIIDSGNGISAAGRNDNLLQGGFTIQLFNDNVMDGIDVSVKLVCLQVRKTWLDKLYTDTVVTPKYISLNKRRLVINTTQVRVNSD